ncbi:aromatic acid exporter family protein [Faecalicatena orotica]|jgi:uncharacterized membrane protein YgaE (UPF0421/DUF939 family)
MIWKEGMTDMENLKSKMKRIQKRDKMPAADTIVQAVRIAAGSGAAMFAASALNLEFAASAGMVTLLTILTTKWETLKLSAARIITFFMAVLLCWIIFTQVKNEGAAFGVFVFFLILASEWIGWRVTASVNAVIGTHFLAVRDFSFSFIMNEFLIILLGITIAVIVNLFQNNNLQRNKIIANMRYTEGAFQNILNELSWYLLHSENREGQKEGTGADAVWEKLELLTKDLDDFIQQARVYYNNTFQPHTSYYGRYFEMREKQCEALHNLHYEMEKIKQVPRQAAVIAEYIHYLSRHVTEMNDPENQLKRLEQLSNDMKKEELPKTREEFESRAVLYHILMDLEDFLNYKRQFVERIDDTQFQIYWKKEVEDFSSPSNI